MSVKELIEELYTRGYLPIQLLGKTKEELEWLYNMKWK